MQKASIKFTSRLYLYVFFTEALFKKNQSCCRIVFFNSEICCIIEMNKGSICIMKTVLFLDIDGVLVPKQIFDPYALEPDLKYRLAQEKNDPSIEKLPDTLVNQVYHHFNKESCTLIRQLADQFDASIVLTTSWRLFFSLEQMKAILNIFDLGPYVTGMTEEGIPRYRVIQDYVMHHGIDRFVVIDDLNMMRQFPNHFVHARFRFEKEQYDCVRKLLSWQV